MGQTERILRIQQMLQEHTHVPRKAFLEALEVSPAQFKRDLSFLRDRFRVPISYDPKTRCYVLTGEEHTQYSLPGPLYTPAEIHALLLMQDLVTQFQAGLLDEHLAPLRERLKLLLGREDLSAADVRRRIRILHMASRPVKPRFFQQVSHATFTRHCLQIAYFNRSRNTASERKVSPQRLVFYRGNWYLDSWCHLRKGLRSFSVDSIQAVQILPEAAREVPEADLDSHLGVGYGIFSGDAEQEAVLLFEPEVASWVRAEVWHSRQVQEEQSTGALLLRVPYAQEHELVMDILRWGPNVRVLAPESLKQLVMERLENALVRYREYAATMDRMPSS